MRPQHSHILDPILSAGKTPSFNILTASCASRVDDGATNKARAVAYTLPVGPSVMVDFIHTLRPLMLSTSAVHRMVEPALIFCKTTVGLYRLPSNEAISFVLSATARNKRKDCTISVSLTRSLVTYQAANTTATARPWNE